MAELTQLESKIAEVMGLAQAAQQSTTKVAKMVEDAEIKQKLERMKEEAAQTEQRCKQIAGQLDGKKSDLQKKAKETKNEAQEMMKAYLGRGSDGLDGLEFLTMAEAAELGHLEIVQAMNRKAKIKPVSDLVKEVLPIQKRHVKDVREASLALAQQEDPMEPAS